MILSDVSIKRPVFATMLMVALVVLGIVGYQRLAIDEYPDVTYPIVIAQTTYPGASPEVIEREVSRPIEEALNTVQGIREVSSTSFEGGSIVRVQLEIGTDPMGAQQDVSAKIARLRRTLPEQAEDPVVIRFDPNDRRSCPSPCSRASARCASSPTWPTRWSRRASRASRASAA
jgi:HAE1 family hydrophobic/amphiphilic exporter-1